MLLRRIRATYDRSLHAVRHANARTTAAQREAMALVLLCAGALTMLSLLSFRAEDGSFNQANGAYAGATQNWVGPMGAAWADLSLQLMGVLAWVLAAALLFFGGRMMIGKAVHIQQRQLLMATSFAICAGTLLELLLLGRRTAYPLGGVLGALLARQLREHFAPVGAAIIASTGAIASLTLCLGGTLSSLSRRLVLVLSDQTGATRERMREALVRRGMVVAAASSAAPSAIAATAPGWAEPLAPDVQGAPLDDERMPPPFLVGDRRTLPFDDAEADEGAELAADRHGASSLLAHLPVDGDEPLVAQAFASESGAAHRLALDAVASPEGLFALDEELAGDLAAGGAAGYPDVMLARPAEAGASAAEAALREREAVFLLAEGDAETEADADGPLGSGSDLRADGDDVRTLESEPDVARDEYATAATAHPDADRPDFAASTADASPGAGAMGARAADLAAAAAPAEVAEASAVAAAVADSSEVLPSWAANADWAESLVREEGEESAAAEAPPPAAAPAASFQGLIDVHGWQAEPIPPAAASQGSDWTGGARADQGMDVAEVSEDEEAGEALAEAALAEFERTHLAPSEAALEPGPAEGRHGVQPSEALLRDREGAVTLEPSDGSRDGGFEPATDEVLTAVAEASLSAGGDAEPSGSAQASAPACGVSPPAELALAGAVMLRDETGQATDASDSAPIEGTPHADAEDLDATDAADAAEAASADSAGESRPFGEHDGPTSAAHENQSLAPVDEWDFDDGAGPPAGPHAAADAGSGFAEAPTAVAAPREYVLPPSSLLEFEAHARPPVDHALLQANAEKLEATLNTYGIEGHVREIRPGPVVTLYEYVPGPGIKVARIASLADDLAMSMEALRVRIVAPIPGKGAVGIEIPNETRETVHLKEIVEHPTFTDATAPLTCALGKDIEGEPVAENLARMPHLLVAGATGAGKSVSVNAMIMSLLFKASPEQVRMIMVDPKMLELSVYEGIPHLLLPVVTDPKKAALALRWAVEEMERRYELLSEVGVRSIESYNGKVHAGMARGEPVTVASHDADLPRRACEPLPFIVVIVDELADLMMVASRDVETSIMRLAQMARAAGIHLILATQRPSVDVLTGVIKANFPTRIAFQVASRHDSRTIIDANGAEHLLGRGDMLLMANAAGGLKRIHGAYVSEEDIEKTVAYVRAQGQPTYDDSILAPRAEEGVDDEDGALDEMYDQAVAVVAETQQASVSMIQRRMRIGYNRAARMVDRMEKEGIVGPGDGAKPREVFVSSQL